MPPTSGTREPACGSGRKAPCLWADALSRTQEFDRVDRRVLQIACFQDAAGPGFEPGLSDSESGVAPRSSAAVVGFYCVCLQVIRASSTAVLPRPKGHLTITGFRTLQTTGHTSVRTLRIAFLDNERSGSGRGRDPHSPSRAPFLVSFYVPKSTSRQLPLGNKTETLATSRVVCRRPRLRSRRSSSRRRVSPRACGHTIESRWRSIWGCRHMLLRRGR